MGQSVDYTIDVVLKKTESEQFHICCRLGKEKQEFDLSDSCFLATEDVAIISSRKQDMIDRLENIFNGYIDNESGETIMRSNRIPYEYKFHLAVSDYEFPNGILSKDIP